MASYPPKTSATNTQLQAVMTGVGNAGKTDRSAILSVQSARMLSMLWPELEFSSTMCRSRRSSRSDALDRPKRAGTTTVFISHQHHVPDGRPVMFFGRDLASLSP